MTTDFNDLRERAMDIAFRAEQVGDDANRVAAHLEHGNTVYALTALDAMNDTLALIEGDRAELRILLRKDG